MVTMNNGKGGRRRGAGRPKGARNKATLARGSGAKSLTELAQEKTENALNVLESIMNDEKAPASVRVSAANSLLDRAHGRPVPGVRVEDEPEPEPANDPVPIRLVKPGDEDFEALTQ